MYDREEEQIYRFHTAADALLEANQRLALAKGATAETGPQSVHVSESDSYHTLAEADGEMYEQLEDSSGITTAFRDPWYFTHPETGEDWMIFEGNTPTEETNLDHPDNYDGNVGAAKATNEELTEWELYPPIVEAVGVSQQTERPHFIFQDGNGTSSSSPTSSRTLPTSGATADSSARRGSRRAPRRSTVSSPTACTTAT